MEAIIPIPTIRFKIKAKVAIPQKAKNAHFFHMNKNTVNTTLANPSIPYTYHIEGGTFGYISIMDEFHNRYVNAVPALAANIIINQVVNSLPRFFSPWDDAGFTNVSVILFLYNYLVINLEKPTNFSHVYYNILNSIIKIFLHPKLNTN